MGINRKMARARPKKVKKPQAKGNAGRPVAGHKGRFDQLFGDAILGAKPRP